MPLIPVIARRAFSIGGRDLRPGDRVEVIPVDAVVLVHARKATFARPLPTRRAPEMPSPKKRSYKRRVVTAEPE